MPGLSSGTCFECRANKDKDGKSVDCENPAKDYRCWVTHKDPTDPIAPMVNTKVSAFVIRAFSQIAAISVVETLKYTKKDKQYSVRLPTITGLGVWMDHYDGWTVAPVTKGRFVRLIGLYYNAFISTRIEAYTAK